MFSFGNKKLPKSTLIFNLCAASDCPSSALGMCQVGNRCYAKQAEVQWTAALRYRRRQQILFNELTVSELVGAFKGAILHRSERDEPVKYIRFSEAGDFKNQYEVDKLTSIFYLLKQWKPALSIYGYTARRDLHFLGLSEVATVNGSGFMLDNDFEAVEEVKEEDLVCPGDCRGCDLCVFPKGLHIKIKFH